MHIGTGKNIIQHFKDVALLSGNGNPPVQVDMPSVEEEGKFRLVLDFIQDSLDSLILHFQVNSCFLSVAIRGLN